MQARQGLYRLPVEIKQHGYCIRFKLRKISLQGVSVQAIGLKEDVNLPENKIVTPPESHSPKLLYRDKILQLYAQMPHCKEK